MGQAARTGMNLRSIFRDIIIVIIESSQVVDGVEQIQGQELCRNLALLRGAAPGVGTGL